MTPYDTLQPTAPQWIANQIIIPAAVGQLLAIFLAGAATAAAIPELRKTHAIPWSRTLLATAVCFNLITAAFFYWAGIVWAVDQRRGLMDILRFKWIDVLSPISSTVAGCAVQTFMAIRCWRLIDRSRLFAVFIGALVALPFASMMWATAYRNYYRLGKVKSSDLFAPTILYMASSAFVDLVIVVVLTHKLHRSREGNGKRTSFILASLTKLAFETFVPPFLVATLGMILYSAARRTPWLWNLWAAVLPTIGSVYIFSFIYCLQSSALVRERAQALSVTSFSVQDGQVVRNVARGLEPVPCVAQDKAEVQTPSKEIPETLLVPNLSSYAVAPEQENEELQGRRREDNTGVGLHSFLQGDSPSSSSKEDIRPLH